MHNICKADTLNLKFLIPIFKINNPLALTNFVKKQAGYNIIFV